MSSKIDFSLLGGAESPFPPSSSSPLLTPSLTASPSSSSSSAASDDEDLPGVKGNAKSEVAGPTTSRSMPKDPNDFLWLATEEPHRSRRRAILKAHPEIRKLMGHTPYTFPLVLLVLSLQLTLALLLLPYHPLSPRFLLTAYALGGTLNQNLFLAIHEITHNLAFKSLLPNKILAMVANLPIGVPYAMAFKGYHIEHHKFLGEEGVDTDLPSWVEAVVLNNVFGKTFFATFQIFFYALRPGFIHSQKLTLYHLLNFAIVLTSDFLLCYFFGPRPILYLLFSSFFAGSLHPCAAHFIAEHYLMAGRGKLDGEGEQAGEVGEEVEGVRELAQETTSYYGWMNVLCYNVGYHNEHHDFPSIPWTRLPELHRIAHEFYDPLPSHPSWPAVTWQFITDPRVGMWSRAKRAKGDKGTKIDDGVWMLDGEAVRKAGESKGRAKKAVSGKREGVKIVGVDVGEEEEDQMAAMMSEAVERGYGSDGEVEEVALKVKKRQ